MLHPNPHFADVKEGRAPVLTASRYRSSEDALLYVGGQEELIMKGHVPMGFRNITDLEWQSLRQIGKSVEGFHISPHNKKYCEAVAFMPTKHNYDQLADFFDRMEHRTVLFSSTRSAQEIMRTMRGQNYMLANDLVYGGVHWISMPEKRSVEMILKLG